MRVARTNENMRGDVQSAEILFAEKTAEMHFPSDAELLREPLQFRLQRPLARDDEFGFGKFPRKDRKGTNGRSDAFLLDQPAGLQDLPVAVGWKFPRCRGKFAERNSGAINSNLFRRATEFDQAI